MSGVCKAFVPRAMATGALNVASDLFILLVPVYGVWGLQMSNAKKLAFVGVFILGAL